MSVGPSVETRSRGADLWIFLIALHSYGVGVTLLFFPELSIQLSGWTTGGGVGGGTGIGVGGEFFFVRQAGVLHLVLATGYLLEYRLLQSVLLMLVAKIAATIFLACIWVLDDPTWVVEVSCAADALMGLVALWVRRRIRSSTSPAAHESAGARRSRGSHRSRS